jgi:YidC/Oxa1 family membrane protein insertase
MLIFANVIEEAFSPLIRLFEAILVFIHNHVVGGSWGLAIVGLTVLIRAVLVPLTLKQFRSMQELQRLAPELKALQEKYKDDKQRQQQEIMNFYREHKVNPFASCLPLLLQLPVFIALFYMLRTDLKKHICGESLVTHYNALHHSTVASVAALPAKYVEKTSCQMVAPGSAKFLFLPDITNKATGVALVVLLVLYVGSQLVSTTMMSASADPNQRRLMMLLPLFFVIIL